MKIGIASKCRMEGGSEFRCAELLSGIAKYTKHDPYYLIIGNSIKPRIKDALHPDVNVFTDVLISEGGNGSNTDKFYEMDRLLIVNSDSYSYCKVEFWDGELRDKNTNELKSLSKVDLTRIKNIAFLFNFVISPSRDLWKMEERGVDVRVITTNERFYNEITYKDKFDETRHLPRMVLNSPIDPNSVSQEKIPSSKIRIGKHSKSVGCKWNPEHIELIKKINDKYPNEVVWDFMGVASEIKQQLKQFNNVIIRDEFSLSVKDYLRGIDIFLFYPEWKRTEPWARVVAEGMASGCPIIATNRGGTVEQVLSGNNGFVCDKKEDFERYIAYFIEHKDMIAKMGKNSIIYSKEFRTENIINKLLNFIL